MYTLVVQNAAEERQIRRLGAAVCLLWKALPTAVQERLVAEASSVHISGEGDESARRTEQILAFLKSDAIRYPRS